jgi:hypothetical protein
VQKWAAETASSKPRSALNRFHLQRWKPGDSRWQWHVQTAQVDSDGLMFIDYYIDYYIDLYTIYILYIDLIAKVCWGRKFHEAYCDIVLRRAAETRWFWCRFWMILVFLVDLNGVLMALVFCIF